MGRGLVWEWVALSVWVSEARTARLLSVAVWLGAPSGRGLVREWEPLWG